LRHTPSASQRLRAVRAKRLLDRASRNSLTKFQPGHSSDAALTYFEALQVVEICFNLLTTKVGCSEELEVIPLAALELGPEVVPVKRT